MVKFKANLLGLAPYIYFPIFEANILSINILLIFHLFFSATLNLAQIRLKFLDLKTFLVE